MVTIVHVGPVSKERNGKPIVDNAGQPCCYFTVGYSAPFQKVRMRNAWGRIDASGSVAWERLSPEKAEEFRRRQTDLEAAYGIRLVARDVEPFTPNGLENKVTAARLLVFPDETEQQALTRLYGADAQFKEDRVRVDEQTRAADVAQSRGSLQVNGAV